MVRMIGSRKKRITGTSVSNCWNQTWSSSGRPSCQLHPRRGISNSMTSYPNVFSHSTWSVHSKYLYQSRKTNGHKLTLLGGVGCPYFSVVVCLTHIVRHVMSLMENNQGLRPLHWVDVWRISVWSPCTVLWHDIPRGIPRVTRGG